ncbi:hypothetical protein BOSEA1005_11521 [Hyphomicrobiales bacterium]|nr:hypothetical protein BOSEA1005_11521 [Hyphomicrobiales bacterium]
MASSPATGSDLAMSSCQMRPRGKCANQRPGIAQFGFGIPNNRRNCAQRSVSAVAPAPMMIMRKISSDIVYPPKAAMRWRCRLEPRLRRRSTTAPAGPCREALHATHCPGAGTVVAFAGLPFRIRRLIEGVTSHGHGERRKATQCRDRTAWRFRAALGRGHQLQSGDPRR